MVRRSKSSECGGSSVEPINYISPNIDDIHTESLAFTVPIVAFSNLPGFSSGSSLSWCGQTILRIHVDCSLECSLLYLECSLRCAMVGVDAASAAPWMNLISFFTIKRSCHPALYRQSHVESGETALSYTHTWNSMSQHVT